MSHISALLHETVDAVLGQKTTGIFVDATFGRGGHSREPLSRLDTDPRLVVFDKDLQALVAAVGRFPFLDCVASFADLATQLKQLGVASVDGIMADLAVSSQQLD